MSSIIWKGGNDDETASHNTGSVMEDEESDDGSSGSDDDDYSDDDRDDELYEEKSDKRKNKSATQPVPVSRKTEMETLRANFNTTDEFRTPRSGESLREFYRYGYLFCCSF
jgi:U3 small nucleolar RNA-associated protein 14